jgi:hypothetical protein
MPPPAPSARHPPPPLPENQHKQHKRANQILYACESELGCEFEFAPAKTNLEHKKTHVNLNLNLMWDLGVDLDLHLSVSMGMI